MRIRDWSSDVCSSDLRGRLGRRGRRLPGRRERHGAGCLQIAQAGAAGMASDAEASKLETPAPRRGAAGFGAVEQFSRLTGLDTRLLAILAALLAIWIVLHLWTGGLFLRSEEDTSELPSLIRTSYAG